MVSLLAFSWIACDLRFLVHVEGDFIQNRKVARTSLKTFELQWHRKVIRPRGHREHPLGSQVLLAESRQPQCTNINRSEESIQVPKLTPSLQDGSTMHIPVPCARDIPSPPPQPSLPIWHVMLASHPDLWNAESEQLTGNRLSGLTLIFVEVPLLLRICPTSPTFDTFIRRFTTNYMRAAIYGVMSLIQWLSIIKDPTSLIAAAIVLLLASVCYLIAGLKGQGFVGSKTLGGQGVAQMIV